MLDRHSLQQSSDRDAVAGARNPMAAGFNGIIAA